MGICLFSTNVIEHNGCQIIIHSFLFSFPFFFFLEKSDANRHNHTEFIIKEKKNLPSSPNRRMAIGMEKKFTRFWFKHEWVCRENNPFLKPNKNYKSNHSKADSNLLKWKWIQKQWMDITLTFSYLLQIESAVTYFYLRRRRCFLRQPFQLSSPSSPEELLHPFDVAVQESSRRFLVA